MNKCYPLETLIREDARHINVGNLSDFVEENIKNNGTFATREQLEGVSNAVAEESGVIERIDNKFTNQLITVGEQIATLQTQTNNYETWTFELESGEIIEKKILIKKIMDFRQVKTLNIPEGNKNN